MRKLVKILFSRLTIVGLCILIQLGVIIWLIVSFNLGSFWFLVSAYIISAIVIIYIIYKDEIPEFKLPWVIVVLLVPGVGALIYALFGHLKLSKKEHMRFSAIREASRHYIRQNADLEELKKKDKEAYLQVNYIIKSSYVPYQDHSDVTYYKLGDYFLPDYLEELKKAKKYIFIEYFIINRGQMWNQILSILEEKVKEGVKVKVLYDDMGSMFLLPSHYYKTLQKLGIDSMPFNRFRPVLSSVFNNRDHRKITVIDGKVGFTGGLNLSDEYINIGSKYGKWKDSAIRIKGPAVKNLLQLFIMNWNGTSPNKLDIREYLDYDPEPISEAKGGVVPFGDGPDPIYKEKIGKTVIMNMINSATKYMYITTPYLICDYELLDALKIAAKKGVDVRIITPHIPDKKIVFMLTRSNYQSLIEEGVKIYEYTPGFIHAKNYVSDDKYAMCGTINLDYRSLVHHFECGAFMYETSCIKDIKEDLDNTIKESEEISLEKSDLNFFQKVLVSLLKAFFPLF